MSNIDKVRKFIEDSGISSCELRNIALVIDIENNRERIRIAQEKHHEIKNALVGKCYKYFD